MSEQRATFLSELERRGLPRPVLVCHATAFAVIEAADFVVPRLALPVWTVTFVVLASLGSPVASYQTPVCRLLSRMSHGLQRHHVRAASDD